MNRVWFFDWPRHGVLGQHEAEDLVNVLFRFDGTFHLHGMMRADRRFRPTLGLHSYDEIGSRHDVYLSSEKIESCFAEGRPCGGNVRAPSLRVAYGMVLAHEIQHANQHRVHDSAHATFFGKRRSKYRVRPCEREARLFADDSVRAIAGVLGEELPSSPLVVIPADELTQVVESMASGSLYDEGQVSMGELVAELRRSGINNAASVSRARELLADQGITVG